MLMTQKIYFHCEYLSAFWNQIMKTFLKTILNKNGQIVDI